MVRSLDGDTVLVSLLAYVSVFDGGAQVMSTCTDSKALQRHRKDTEMRIKLKRTRQPKNHLR